MTVFHISGFLLIIWLKNRHSVQPTNLRETFLKNDELSWDCFIRYVMQLLRFGLLVWKQPHGTEKDLKVEPIHLHSWTRKVKEQEEN